MARIFITGGSGFIGSNLVEYLALKQHSVLNFDKNPPRNKASVAHWIKGDILDKPALEKAFSDFQPDYVVHLAARTDLDENKSLKGYAANIEGVANMIDLVNAAPVKRTIYASSRMVCRIDYIPNSFEDFCPPNLYGESKMIGEKMVRETAIGDYVVIRPTSIWGPYFEIPYRTFFDMVRKKLFFLPKGHRPKKSFGYVGNTIYQLDKILFADRKDLQPVYYVADYPPLDLRRWANMVADEFHVGKTREIPMFVLKTIAIAGDIAQKLGWRNPPLTSFRLDNLVTNMVYDTNALEELCGPLPYSLERGVRITADWVKKQAEENTQKT
jgi:nucleoside-diphosphate-sugar epimerase